MIVTVCELHNDMDRFESDWKALAGHTNERSSDLIVLPEMPFYRWLPGTDAVDPAEWEKAVQAHERWMERLGELGAGIVVGSRPVLDGERRFNECFIWERSSGMVRKAHRKYYLPRESGFWEANWYERGEKDFRAIDVPGAKIGFMTCTDLWFTEHARAYGHDGAHLIITPRGTMAYSREKWVVGGRAAAITSGAYSLSSNFRGPAAVDGDWAGRGWIIEPEAGEVLGGTSAEEPFLTMDIDLTKADDAKKTYPRYVLE